MEPISNQPPPYSQWDIDLYALQKQHRHEITVQTEMSNLPKPFDLSGEKLKEIKKNKKEDTEKNPKDKNDQKSSPQ
jgi:hypothetical protein